MLRCLIFSCTWNRGATNGTGAVVWVLLGQTRFWKNWPRSSRTKSDECRRGHVVVLLPGHQWRCSQLVSSHLNSTETTKLYKIITVTTTNGHYPGRVSLLFRHRPIQHLKHQLVTNRKPLYERTVDRICMIRWLVGSRPHQYWPNPCNPWKSKFYWSSLPVQVSPLPGKKRTYWRNNPENNINII